MVEVKLDWSVLRRAKVTQSDFAAIVGVSRVTVNSWIHGKPVNQLRMTKIQRVIESLSQCVAEGALPLPHTNGNTERLRDITKVMYNRMEPKN